MTQSLGAKTMPEYFEKRWNSKGLKIAAALIVFVFLIPYTASVYNGLSRLFNMAFQIESEGAYKIIIIVMALLTAIYVILGGYAATAINDFIQGIVMLIGIAAVVICAIQNQGGLTSALAALGEIEVNGKTNTLNSVFGPDPLNLLGVVILTSLGTWGLPQMIHKFYAIKRKRHQKGAVILLFCPDRCRRFLLLGGFDRLFCTLTEDGSGGP
ncbi:MAG: sodium:solute symporter family transporter [Ruminococcus callidus]